MQSPLIFDETDDALRAAVMALGGSKKVGPAMKPDLSIVAATQWCNDCLNPERPQRFTPDQVVYLFRECARLGYHDAMRFFATQCGYQAPQPVDPGAELADIQRQTQAAVSALVGLLKRTGALEEIIAAEVSAAKAAPSLVRAA